MPLRPGCGENADESVEAQAEPDTMDAGENPAPTTLGIVRSGTVRTERIDPGTLGLRTATVESLRASDESHAAEMVRGVLAGEAGPAADMVLLTAGAALVVAGAASTIAEGIGLARQSVASGRASEALATLARVSHA